MSKYLEEARRLRAIVEPHYNCCQSVVMPFAGDGASEPEAVRRLCANLGGGIKRGDAMCGAVLGGMMVLGLFGITDKTVTDAYYARIAEHHEGCLRCAELLSLDRAKGHEDKKPHCDALVCECVSLAEELLRREGKL